MAGIVSQLRSWGEWDEVPRRIGRFEGGGEGPGGVRYCAICSTYVEVDEIGCGCGGGGWVAVMYDVNRRQASATMEISEVYDKDLCFSTIWFCS